MNGVFVATPVFDGAEVVAETLASIQAQTFTDLRVLISVDGADERSAEVCRPFTIDPRFELVVQPRRLGWAGNLNWLMQQSDRDLFCFWQQDDLADPSYLERLRGVLQSQAQAAAAYCDVQWFGSRSDLVQQDPLLGSPMRRVVDQLDRLSWAAFHGVVRANALEAAGPLRLTEFDSSHEDLVWLAKLARHGELHRLPEALYRKRAHDRNTHLEWSNWPDERRRAALLELGLGFVEAALPLLSATGRIRWAQTVAARLSRRGDWSYYSFPSKAEREAFEAELLEASLSRFGDPRARVS